MSLSAQEKERSAGSKSHECVCGTVCVCVCLADCSTQSSDIPSDSPELFMVPGLSESEEQKERGAKGRVGGREGGEGGKPRQKVGTECGVRLSGDGIRACMFWRGEVPACSPISTC